MDGADLRDFLDEASEHLDGLADALDSGRRDAEAAAELFRHLHTLKGGARSLGLRQLESALHDGEGVLHGGGALDDGSLERLRALVNDVDRQVGELRDGRVLEHARPDAASPTSPAPAVAPRVRIDVACLARLAETASDLALDRGQLAELARTTQDARLAGAVQRLRAHVARLHEGLAEARMEPTKTLWRRLPGVVQDLAGALGKRVVLETSGGETRVDRRVVDALAEPLVHAIRNAVDHGIEPAEARRLAGKPAVGRIRLSAAVSASALLIEVADDGGGIDLDALRLRAVQRRLLGLREATFLDDDAALALAFAPGLSTAGEVTTVSGRGVGLDAVKAAAESLGGSARLRSRDGAGTTLAIEVPLSVGLMPAFIVHSAGERWAVPMAAAREVAWSALEPLPDAPAVALASVRGRPVPAIRVGRTAGAPRGAAIVLVVATSRGLLGLAIDGVSDEEDLLVQPLPGRLDPTGVAAGAAVLGDGTAVVVLDPNGLARTLPAAVALPPDAAVSAAAPHVDAFVTVDDVHATRYGIPVAHVSRVTAHATAAAAGVPLFAVHDGRLGPQTHEAGAVLLVEVAGRHLGIVSPGGVDIDFGPGNNGVRSLILDSAWEPAP